jgi:hypothetical protein
MSESIEVVRFRHWSMTRVRKCPNRERRAPYDRSRCRLTSEKAIHVPAR